MFKPKLFVFDLDGTLIDSVKDLAAAVNFAFAEMNLPGRTIEEVRTAIGNGALKLIFELLPDGQKHRKDEAFNIFIGYYTKNCDVLTEMYPGVQDYLEALKGFRSRGIIKVGLLTNKPEMATLEILKSKNMMQYFDGIIGGDTLPVRKPEPDGLEQLMRDFQASPGETIMVGDSQPDYLAAKNAGVKSLGIGGGFGTESLIEPDLAINNFMEINSLNLLPDSP